MPSHAVPSEPLTHPSHHPPRHPRLDCFRTAALFGIGMKSPTRTHTHTHTHTHTPAPPPELLPRVTLLQHTGRQGVLRVHDCRRRERLRTAQQTCNLHPPVPCHTTVHIRHGCLRLSRRPPTRQPSPGGHTDRRAPLRGKSRLYIPTICPPACPPATPPAHTHALTLACVLRVRVLQPAVGVRHPHAVKRLDHLAATDLRRHTNTNTHTEGGAWETLAWPPCVFGRSGPVPIPHHTSSSPTQFNQPRPMASSAPNPSPVLLPGGTGWAPPTDPSEERLCRMAIQWCLNWGGESTGGGRRCERARRATTDHSRNAYGP